VLFTTLLKMSHTAMDWITDKFRDDCWTARRRTDFDVVTS
jgi:hypothetical protein